MYRLNELEKQIKLLQEQIGFNTPNVSVKFISHNHKNPEE